MKYNNIILTLVNILVTVEQGVAFIDLETKNGRPAFDETLYTEVLDPELCRLQLENIRRNTLLWLQFVESGIKIPRSITLGNTVDLGNYPQCLGIKEDTYDTTIEGKYCSINVPFNQELGSTQLPDWFPDRFPPSEWFPDGFPPSNWFPDGFPPSDWFPDGFPPSEWFPDGIQPPDWLPDWITNPRNFEFRVDEKVLNRLQQLKRTKIERFLPFGVIKRDVRTTIATNFNISFTIAVCVPKVCTVREGLNGLYVNTTALGFQFEEQFCRLINDKPWVPADYVAIAIFSTLGLLTILSTGYDIYKTLIIKSDPKSISTLYRSFSVYTNGRRLTTFNKIPGTLECLDGIRSIAMIWVVVGHTYITLPPHINGFDVLNWVTSIDSFYITSAPITVDTFFMLSGLLAVFTTANKMTGIKLVKNLHLFYLNRLLRMFPLLAAAVLLQASLYHHIFDGPNWYTMAEHTENCRRNWWITLLHLQNILNIGEMCIIHSWYVAIDVHLYIVSPIVLFFVLGRKKKIAWSALLISLLVVITSTAVYVTLMKFNAATVTVNSTIEEFQRYSHLYYFNTLARASPFFVGMIFGYILHLYRDSKLQISKFTALLLWICAFGLTTAAVFSFEPMKGREWDNQTVNALVNTLSRPSWATGLGWIIVACVHGYAGPIDWFLSLQMWKLPSRISYAMYLFHFPIMFIAQGTAVDTIYFTEIATIYEFCSQFVISFVFSFFATLLIDSPFSTIFKIMLSGGTKQKPQEKKEIEENPRKENEESNSRNQQILNNS